jgi:hypothetical protein
VKQEPFLYRGGRMRKKDLTTIFEQQPQKELP